MNRILRTGKIGVIAAAALLFGSLAHGDDTEIFLNSPDAITVKPNVIVVIDTSGAMASVVNTRETYNPYYTYPNAGCDPNKIYWSARGQTPTDCTTATNWFYKTQNKCKNAGDVLASAGSFMGRLAMYNNHPATVLRAWSLFDPNWHDGHAVECEADWGTDGESGASNPYPVNGQTSAWTSVQADGVSWRRTGSTYTLFDGNYLNYVISTSTQQTPKSRMDVVKDAVLYLLDTITNTAQGQQQVNIALMRWDEQSHGGYFLTDMTPVNNDPWVIWPDITNKEYLQAVVAGIGQGVGNVSLAEALYEANRYWTGQTPFWGASHYAGDEPFLTPTGTYKTPMNYECQRNFMIILTADYPNADGESDAAITALPSFSGLSDPVCAYPDDDCADEMAEYLYNHDAQNTINSLQNVITYTIGFQITDPSTETFLQEIARKGRGRYTFAPDSIRLENAVRGDLADIMGINTTFAAPAVTVNAFNRLTHRSELYFALFRPDERTAWPGNIKKYWFGRKPGDPNSSLAIRDANYDAAVDENTGFFKNTSKSFWSTVVDGEAVTRGGAASLLTSDRNTYSDIVGGEALSSQNNKLRETNPVINPSLLGGGVTPTERDLILEWVRGLDVRDENLNNSTTDARNYMGDPLHTQPVLVTYNSTSIVLFGTTNEGFLHAINVCPSCTDSGKELWAYMPSDLLHNLKTLWDNPVGTVSQTTPRTPYGLDGPLAVYIKDVDHDGVIESGDGDLVYLYVTMRMGGRNIYALNVTNPTDPRLIWTIKGGVTSGFDELGQTWSRPQVVKVKMGGVGKTVLIFGGGYDMNQENPAAGADSMGRAIFVVDPATGSKLWQAGPNGNFSLPLMTNSIPSDVRVIDLNDNGYADRMYVGDTAGQIWRFDIDEAATDWTNFVKTDGTGGGVIAKLGLTDVDTTQADRRRFFYEPDVSINRNLTDLNIAIGSGHRGQPLDSASLPLTNDRFFVLHEPVSAMGNYTSPIVFNELYNYVAHSDDCATKRGFYIDLQRNKLDPSATAVWEGEKVLAESLTIDNQVNFTTFTPASPGTIDPTAPRCVPSQGEGRIYKVDIPDKLMCAFAPPIEVVHLNQPTIPPAPQVICTGEGCAVLVGPQVVQNPKISRNPKKYYWRNN